MTCIVRFIKPWYVHVCFESGNLSILSGMQEIMLYMKLCMVLYLAALPFHHLQI